MAEEKKRFTLLVQDGSPEKLDTALRLILSAVALEMDVGVYFTSTALRWMTKREAEGLTMVLDPKKGKETITQVIRKAKQMGSVKVYACSEAMNVLGVKTEDLVAEVDKTAGFGHGLRRDPCNITWSGTGPSRLATAPLL